MTKREHIKWHKQQMEESIAIAKKCVRQKTWIVAADCYRAASYHEAIYKALLRAARNDK